MLTSFVAGDFLCCRKRDLALELKKSASWFFVWGPCCGWVWRSEAYGVVRLPLDRIVTESSTDLSCFNRERHMRTW